MRVRALDGVGDWTFGKGQNDYLFGKEAIGQNIQTRVSSFLGDCFFDTAAGIDWFNLLGSKNELGLNLAISAVILNTPGVTRVNQLVADLNRTTRRFTVQYDVTVAVPVFSSNTIAAAVTILLDENGSILTDENGVPLAAET